MSLETEIAELRGTVTALTTVMEQMVKNQERLLAGQEKAIEAVKQGNPAAVGRGRKKATETESTATQNTSDEPAATVSGAEDAASASEKPAAAASAETTKAPLKFAEAAKKWLDKEAQGSDGYKLRGKTIMGILANFGAAKMSELEDGDEAKAMFYLKRAASGLTINFDAAYDFAGDPKQDEPAAEAAAADEDEDMFA